MEAESSEIDYTGRAKEILGFSRWWQIVAAAGMMAAVSPYQYVWSSIEGPLSENLDIALPALGAVFSFYVVFQSLSQMPAGWWRDKRGPQNLTYLAAGRRWIHRTRVRDDAVAVVCVVLAGVDRRRDHLHRRR